MTHNRRYRLLKDLPDGKSGDIFKIPSFGNKNWYVGEKCQLMFHAATVENNPEWFELISEDKKERIEVWGLWQSDEQTQRANGFAYTIVVNNKLEVSEYESIKNRIAWAINNEQEDKGFVWTDELVCEFTSWSLNDSPTFQGRYSDVEQFKKFKQSGATWKDGFAYKTATSEQSNEWEIVEVKEKSPASIKRIIEMGHCNTYEEYIGNCLKNGGSIHSVKRLSDGETFSIGDEVVWEKETSFIIDSFEIMESKDMMARKKPSICSKKGNGYNFLYLKKSSTTAQQPQDRKVLFTTEDGKDIFKWDELIHLVTGDFSVHVRDSGICYKWANDTQGKFRDEVREYKYFSTEKAANEYVLMNKPCLSLNDLLNNWGTENAEYYRVAPLFQKFEKIAQSKIN